MDLISRVTPAHRMPDWQSHPPAAGKAAVVDPAQTPVVLESVAVRPDMRSAAHRVSAAFVAQLIATRGQVPQTRAYRRAEPAEAVDIYRASQDAPRPAGGSLARTL
jgi:hypothetical protein